MILHSIRVGNWRCFLGENEVGPFSDGLNILHAPNATGKSTLFEALRCALMDNHNTKGEDVSRLRPWGRDLSPRVEVEFSVGGQRYRVRKTFLDRPESILERLESGTFRPIAEGPKADVMTRGLFTRDAPKKGLSRPEHWGVLQVLWAPQGRPDPGALSGNIIDDIRQSLSEQVIDSRTRGVGEKLQKLYETYFTPTGRIRSGSPVLSCDDAIAVARSDLELARAEYADVERASETVRRLAESLERRESEIRMARDDVAALESKAREYEELGLELERKTAETKMAESEYRRLKAHVDGISAARRERDSLRERISAQLSRIPELEADRERLAGDLAAAETSLGSAREDLRRAEALEHRAMDATMFRDLKERLASLDGRIGTAATAAASLEVHRRDMTEEVFPSAVDMKRIREAFGAYEKAMFRFESSLITLEITPVGDVPGNVEAGDGTGPVTFRAGALSVLRGAPEVRVTVPSFGSIRAFGPCDSADEARLDVRKTELLLRELVSPYGTMKLADLEELFEKGASIERDIERDGAALDAILAGESLDGLRSRRSRLESDMDEIRGRYGGTEGWNEASSDFGSNLQETRSGKLAASDRASEALKRRDGAKTLFMEAESLLATSLERIKNDRERLEDGEKRLAELESDGKTHDERESELSRFLMAWDAARARVEVFRNRLGGFAENPVNSLRAKREGLRAMESACRAANEELIRESAKLDGLSARGLYSALAGMAERLERLEEKKRSDARTMASIRLLHDAFESCRSEMVGVVTRAASSRATEIYSRICGAPSGALILGESLAPAAFVPSESGNEVELDALSGGEREQLGFAVRMALASCLGGDGRQLLVLDDTFMATDSVRFSRILGIIEDAAANMQILILTCHPERFGSLEAAVRFDLGSASAGATESLRDGISLRTRYASGRRLC
jgi:DNA repair exonuclease SbcCD ATPase subunit